MPPIGITDVIVLHADMFAAIPFNDAWFTFGVVLSLRVVCVCLCVCVKMAVVEIDHKTTLKD